MDEAAHRLNLKKHVVGCVVQWDGRIGMHSPALSRYGPRRCALSTCVDIEVDKTALRGNTFVTWSDTMAWFRCIEGVMVACMSWTQVRTRTISCMLTHKERCATDTHRAQPVFHLSLVWHVCVGGSSSSYAGRSSWSDTVGVRHPIKWLCRCIRGGRGASERGRAMQTADWPRQSASTRCAGCLNVVLCGRR